MLFPHLVVGVILREVTSCQHLCLTSVRLAASVDTYLYWTMISATHAVLCGLVERAFARTLALIRPEIAFMEKRVPMSSGYDLW